MPNGRCWPALIGAFACLMAAVSTTATAGAETDRLTVTEQTFDDLKSVYATVRSRDLIAARVRTGGTVAKLVVDEGDMVEAGQMLAVVTDPKIAIEIESLDARIDGLESQVATAQIDYDRALTLRQQGVTPQARVDQLKTVLDVATNQLKSARSDRLVSEQKANEGKVLAPATGRVLKVPVTVGSVVLMGETIANIAANEFLLRLALPERHALFMKKGDSIRLGSRGGATPASGPSEPIKPSEGRIVQVYPELDSGRVIADAEAPGLTNYYVGERALVWISAGSRKAVVVPDRFIFKRFGLDYARVIKPNGGEIDVVVQLGQPRAIDGEAGREVLAGLEPGDVIAVTGDAR